MPLDFSDSEDYFASAPVGRIHSGQSHTHVAPRTIPRTFGMHIADSSISQAQVQFVNEFIQSREGGFLSVSFVELAQQLRLMLTPLIA
jgi:hypothetical protein